VMELFFGSETRTPDDLIIWCCEKLGIRAAQIKPVSAGAQIKPVSAGAQTKPVSAGAQTNRPSHQQKNEAE